MEDLKVGDYFIYSDPIDINHNENNHIQRVINIDVKISGESIITSFFLDDGKLNLFSNKSYYYQHCQQQHNYYDDKKFSFENGIPVEWEGVI